MLHFEQLEPRQLLSCVVSDRGSSVNVRVDGELLIEETDFGDMSVICLDDGVVTFEQDFEFVSRLNVRGGSGEDQVYVSLFGFAPLRLNISTYAGDDVVNVVADEIAERSYYRLRLGSGDDAASVIVDGDIASNFSVSIDGNTGNDVIDVLTFGLIVDGRAHVNVVMGDGADSTRLFMRTDDGLFQPLVRVNGGAGLDVVEVDEFLSQRGLVDTPLVEVVELVPRCSPDDLLCEES